MMRKVAQLRKKEVSVLVPDWKELPGQHLSVANNLAHQRLRRALYFPLGLTTRLLLSLLLLRLLLMVLRQLATTAKGY